MSPINYYCMDFKKEEEVMSLN